VGATENLLIFTVREQGTSYYEAAGQTSTAGLKA
jgi:hypothetical protein